MSIWKDRAQGQFKRERAAERLDCFLTITYIYPYVLDPSDVELMAMRDKELSLISKYTTYGFFALYGMGLGYRVLRRGNFPYFRDWVKHSVLLIGCGLGTGMLCEKVAAEMHYNKILVGLADKYNFTPQEVTELQRNLNEYYIEREREEDLAHAN